MKIFLEIDRILPQVTLKAAEKAGTDRENVLPKCWQIPVCN
jgi:hypothetical protein